MVKRSKLKTSQIFQLLNCINHLMSGPEKKFNYWKVKIKSTVEKLKLLLTLDKLSAYMFDQIHLMAVSPQTSKRLMKKISKLELLTKISAIKKELKEAPVKIKE
jgi:hypothetical protein